MFSRVSTVDFSNYINRRYISGFNTGFGIVPAKKWSGTLSDKLADWEQQQIESDWIEVREEEPDEYGYKPIYTFYPEYTQPAGKNLPNFVSLYREEDGKPSYNSFRALIGEGTPSVRQMIADEKKKAERFAPGVPIIEILVGKEDGRIPIQKLQRHMRRLPKKLTPNQMREVRARLKAVGGMSMPIPKGPMPTRAPKSR